MQNIVKLSIIINHRVLTAIKLNVSRDGTSFHSSTVLRRASGQTASAWQFWVHPGFPGEVWLATMHRAAVKRPVSRRSADESAPLSLGGRRTYASGASLLNALGDEQDATIRAAFGPHYARLVEIKRAYDPTHFFSINQNIKP